MSFPSSTVDRITPEASPETRDELEQSVGVPDRWPVVTEPFREWVGARSVFGDLVEDRALVQQLPDTLRVLSRSGLGAAARTAASDDRPAPA